MMMAACVAVLTLLLSGCGKEEVDEAAFRRPLLGKWVQEERGAILAYWDFQADGRILDAAGNDIGHFKSANAWNRVTIKTTSGPEFTSEYSLAAGGKSLSLLGSRYRPFTRPDDDQNHRALLRVQRPEIDRNLKVLMDAAAELRQSSGRTTLTYADLVGPGRPLAEGPKPVAGEDYTQLVFNGITPVIVTTSYGLEVLAQEPQPNATLP